MHYFFFILFYIIFFFFQFLEIFHRVFIQDRGMYWLYSFYLIKFFAACFGRFFSVIVIVLSKEDEQLCNVQFFGFRMGCDFKVFCKSIYLSLLYHIQVSTIIDTTVVLRCNIFFTFYFQVFVFTYYILLLVCCYLLPLIYRIECMIFSYST